MKECAEPASRCPDGLLWTWVRRAFPLPPAATEIQHFWKGEWSGHPPAVFPHSTLRERLILVIPTLIRGRADAGVRLPLGLVEAITRLREAFPDVDAAVCVVAQDEAGQSRRYGAIQVLAEDWAARVVGDGIPLVGMAVAPASKIAALNATLRLQDANATGAIAWFDDDVELEPEVLAALWAEYSPAFEGVLGACKRNTGGGSGFSRAWAQWKNRRERVNLYPHGCAMLMSRRVFGGGIPPETISDDHYYLFRLLQPNEPNRMRLLRVVSDAVVRVPAANGVGAILRRTFRNYRNVQRVMAGFPVRTMRCFLWDVHFCGLRRPASWHRAVQPGYWLAVLVDAAKLSLFAGIFALSVARGVTGRPWRRLWYSAPAAREGARPAGGQGTAREAGESGVRLAAR